jgi:hypothetical protein
MVMVEVAEQENRVGGREGTKGGDEAGGDVDAGVVRARGVVEGEDVYSTDV